MSDRHPQRTVDPWNDTDVIDAWAPRANQTVVGLVALAGVVFGWPLAWALMGAQLAIGLTLGRRFCIPCVAYFELIQPRIGEGPIEDSRPPRLANMIGTVFLLGAAIAWWAGAPAIGVVMGAIVAALALLAASTGLCAGCEIYKLTARLRGIQPRHHDHIDPADLGPAFAESLNGNEPAGYVQFTHPMCSDCREWADELAGRDEPSVIVDVREQPDLAHKYGIAVVPAVFAIAADGEVLERLAP